MGQCAMQMQLIVWMVKLNCNRYWLMSCTNEFMLFVRSCSFEILSIVHMVAFGEPPPCDNLLFSTDHHFKSNSLIYAISRLQIIDNDVAVSVYDEVRS